MIGIKAWVLAMGLLVAPVAAAPPADKNENTPNKADKKAGALTALFKKLDTNNDGKVSQAEFAKLKDAAQAIKGEVGKKTKPAKVAKAKKAKKAAKKADKTAALFKKLDTNNDGFLTPAEFQKLKEVKKAAKGQKKAKK